MLAASLLTCNWYALQARLPELSKQLNARTEELSDVRFQLEEDKATASAAQVTASNSNKVCWICIIMLLNVSAPLKVAPIASCKAWAAAMAETAPTQHL